MVYLIKQKKEGHLKSFYRNPLECTQIDASRCFEGIDLQSMRPRSTILSRDLQGSTTQGTSINYYLKPVSNESAKPKKQKKQTCFSFVRFFPVFVSEFFLHVFHIFHVFQPGFSNRTNFEAALRSLLRGKTQEEELWGFSEPV